MKKMYPFFKIFLLFIFLFIFKVNSYANPADLFSRTYSNNYNNNVTSTIISVAQTVTASFSVNAEMQCIQGNRFVFSNSSSSGNGVSYSWNFGDGTTSTETNPSKTYSKWGYYRILLEVRLGSEYTYVDKYITVTPVPKVDYQILTQTLNGNSFTFVSTSTMEIGNLQYSWDFGDSTYSNIINPTKTFSRPDNFNVKLVATSDMGCKDSITKVVRNIQGSFSVNAEKQCLQGNRFVFNNGSSSGDGISYSWNFGDGTTSTEANPAKSYNQWGFYRVHFEIRTATDARTADKYITVMPTPHADFQTYPTATGYTYVSSSTVAIGQVSLYSWNFGDSTFGSAINPTKIYNRTDSYHVKLVATSDFGCVDSVSKIIAFHSTGSGCELPVAAFTVNADSLCKNGNNFILTNNSSVNSGSLSYTWNFGDGTSSAQTSPSKSYSSTGNYTITLITTNSLNGGCNTSFSKTINVVGSSTAFVPNPTALQCLAGNSFEFTNESIATSGNLSYKWDFGDGTASTAVSPVKIYNTSGTYNVTLISKMGVTGCSDTIQNAITVYPSPVASFDINAQNLCKSGNSFSFNNNSSVASGSLNYIWTFGDGTTANDINPVKSYSNTGSYTVILKATENAGGCFAMVTKSVKVTGVNIAFVANPTTLQCFKGNHFDFTNETTSNAAGIVSYTWDLGNGTSSIEIEPGISYATAGVYHVKLVAKSNSLNCMDSITQTLTVYPSPSAGFYTGIVSNNGTNSEIRFTNTSSISNAAVHYKWGFGDGAVDDNINPYHVYATHPATQIVQLVAISENGCTDTASRTLTVANGLSSGISNILSNPAINAAFFDSSNTASNAYTLVVFPNPFVSYIQLNFRTVNTAFVQIKVVDFYGRVLIAKTEPVTVNNQNYGVSLDLRYLSHGNYLLQVLNDKGSIIGYKNILKAN